MKPKTIASVSGAVLSTILLLVLQPPALAQDAVPVTKTGVTLRIYGPGGPGPAMREAAKVFASQKGISVVVSEGPTPTWRKQAMTDADLIYSGAEHMMSDFTGKDLSGLIDKSTIRTLYLRPSAILVRPGNPKNIKGVRDLAKSDVRILVVQGAGQVGMWEDVAGRTGDVKLVDNIRRNIIYTASNSGDAKTRWNGDTRFDAWLIWTTWQKDSPALADLIHTEPENTIYRSSGVAITRRSEKKILATEFADFLQSQEGQQIFVKLGWLAP